jgi:tetratricopeptide (TPR) repeat protein
VVVLVGAGLPQRGQTLALEAALAMVGRGSPEVRAMALAGVGSLALEQGDLDRAQEACEEGLELLAHEEAREAIEAKLNLLVGLGWVAWQREEHDQATQLYEESLALSREMSDTWWIASSLSNLATVSLSLGDSERATELYEERQVYADPSSGGHRPSGRVSGKPWRSSAGRDNERRVTLGRL